EQVALLGKDGAGLLEGDGADAADAVADGLLVEAAAAQLAVDAGVEEQPPVGAQDLRGGGAVEVGRLGAGQGRDRLGQGGGGGRRRWWGGRCGRSELRSMR